MKRTFLLLSLAVALTTYSAEAQEKKGNEKQAILKVVKKAYVDGLLNGGDLSFSKKGFHPEFNLLIQKEGELKKWPITDWIKRAEDKKKNKPDDFKVKYKAKFPLVDITGSSAVLKVELYKAGALKYTDYLALYKYKEGWKIVSKIYWDHERKN